MSRDLSLAEVFQLGYYWETKILLTAVKLDVFSALDQGTKTAEDVAGRIGADAKALSLLLNALVALRLFRQPLLARLQTRDSGQVDSIVGDAAMPSSALAPGGRGKAEVRGALWNARNVSDRAIAARERCRVVAVNGLELDIRPE